MDIKFNKDDDDGIPLQGVVEEKGKQNLLLIVLLILVGGFGYIYFFTDLIKPTQEQKVAEAPPVSQVVKKPLPVPGGELVKVVPAGTEEKNVVAVPVKPEPVKVAPAPVPASTPAPAAVPAIAKPVAPEAAKPKEVVKKVAASPAVVKKPLPVIAETKTLPAKNGEKKIAEAKKPVEKVNKHADASSLPKKPLQKSAKKVPVVSGAAAVSGNWTVLVGNYVLEEALVTDLSRVRKAGLKAFVVSGPQKKTHMNRLMLGEFASRASAQIELDKLKRVTSDAFIIESAGKHVVYAGSYLVHERALSEKERLAAAGFVLTLKRADVSIPTKNLTAGAFADKNAAEDILNKLRTAGVKASLSR